MPELELVFPSGARTWRVPLSHYSLVSGHFSLVKQVMNYYQRDISEELYVEFDVVKVDRPNDVEQPTYTLYLIILSILVIALIIAIKKYPFKRSDHARVLTHSA